MKILFLARVLPFSLLTTLLLLGSNLSCSDPGTAGESRLADSEEAKIILDSRNQEVIVPEEPRRVATVSDGLVEEVMLHFGILDRLVGIGSTCLIRNFSYNYSNSSGENFSVSGGMNPVRFLEPEIQDLPLFVRPGTEINYESLALLEPDVLIIDMGACTLSWRHDLKSMEQGLSRLKSLGIPTVVLMGPNSGGRPGTKGISDEIEILGMLFNRPVEALQLSSYLEGLVGEVADRTRTIPREQQRDFLLLGLNPSEGGVAQGFGPEDIQSRLAEEFVNGRNAFRGPASAVLNLEQILALEPDVILLPTANGYHPPRELFESPRFQMLRLMEAVQEKRVAALPWSPCNCDKRLEYPLDVFIMAKTIYPEIFTDLDLVDSFLSFYRFVYKVDREQAMGLLRAQWLAWALSA